MLEIPRLEAVTNLEDMEMETDLILVEESTCQNHFEGRLDIEYALKAVFFLFRYWYNEYVYIYMQI